MAINLSKEDLDQLQSLLISSGVVRNPFAAQTFIDAALEGSPRAMDIAGQVNLGGNARTTAVHLITTLARFGKDMPGRESLLLLIDELKRNVGEDVDRKLYLDGLAARYQLSTSFPVSKTTDTDPFEKLVRRSNAFKDVLLWRERLGVIEQQVCRITAPCVRSGRIGQCMGTGFLVASDAVLTNWHVLSDVIAAPELASQVKFQFDFKRINADDDTGTSQSFNLVAGDGKWLIDSSPMDDVDEMPDPKPREADPERLDYALLRLNGRPGDARGWIREIAVDHDFLADPALFIVQHPNGQPMKLALDTEAVVAINANGSRVRYRTNTEPGSSGSPCFNQKWELVALHHSGEPVLNAKWNEGIPIKAVLELLKQRGKLDGLG